MISKICGVGFFFLFQRLEADDLSSTATQFSKADPLRVTSHTRESDEISWVALSPIGERWMEPCLPLVRVGHTRSCLLTSCLPERGGLMGWLCESVNSWCCFFINQIWSWKVQPMASWGLAGESFILPSPWSLVTPTSTTTTTPPPIGPLGFSIITTPASTAATVFKTAPTLTDVKVNLSLRYFYTSFHHLEVWFKPILC